MSTLPNLFQEYIAV